MRKNFGVKPMLYPQAVLKVYGTVPQWGHCQWGTFFKTIDIDIAVRRRI